MIYEQVHDLSYVRSVPESMVRSRAESVIESMADSMAGLRLELWLSPCHRMDMAVFTAWLKSRSMGETGTADQSVTESRAGSLVVSRARSRMGPTTRSILYLWLCAMVGSVPMSMGWPREALV